MSNKLYVDSKELEKHWTNWLKTNNEQSWDILLNGIYKICNGVARKFSPPNDEEHDELAHEAFILTINKIKSGKLKFTPGKAPVFNLLTTAIFRHLYSKMNRDSRRREVLASLRQEQNKEAENEIDQI
jgi:hypothetical protein